MKAASVPQSPQEWGFIRQKFRYFQIPLLIALMFELFWVLSVKTLGCDD